MYDKKVYLPLPRRQIPPAIAGNRLAPGRVYCTEHGVETSRGWLVAGTTVIDRNCGASLAAAVCGTAPGVNRSHGSRSGGSGRRDPVSAGGPGTGVTFSTDCFITVRRPKDDRGGTLPGVRRH